MKRGRWGLACLALALWCGIAQADSDDSPSYVVSWWAIVGGGGVSVNDDWELEGSVGQSGIGLFGAGNSSHSFLAGFWSIDWENEGEDDDDDDRARPVDGDALPMVAGAKPALSPAAEAPIVAFSLAKAYPNPSAGRTRIAWTVPVRSHVRLTVLDVQGRLVTSLADGEHAPGRYEVTWNNLRAGGAKPGMYFVRLDTPEQTFVRRVVLAH